MIKIYGTPVCTFCKQAIALAEQYQFKYTYVDAMENPDEFSSKFPNAKTVPQITWNDRHIGGYTEFAREIENTIGGYGDGKI